MINVVSVRVGTKYGPEYVHILHDMVQRNLSTVDVAHWCVTDDPDSLPTGVNYIPHNPDLPGWWQKVYLFAPEMPWAVGERIMYFDLDVAITGRLEDMPKGIIKDWLWPCYNSSVMVWDCGEHAAIWRDFKPAYMDRQCNIVPPECLPVGQVNGGDQEWITECSKWQTFPSQLCLSARTVQDWPPSDCRVVVFHGAHKPDKAEGWVKDVWKVGGLTSLPVMGGCNVTRENVLNNMRENVKLDLPWFSGFGEQKGSCVIVCGGPSMKDHVQQIKDHKRRGSRIVSVNNALDFLVGHNIMPDIHVMMDARPDNITFLANAPKGVRYFMASQCDPSLFERLEDHNVVVWHNGAGDLDEQWEIVNRDDKPAILVPGGGTVGLRALWLAHFSGYRSLHVYGMDSSYADNGHHAYAQPLNDGEQTQTVLMNGKPYTCARWMMRQAEEFKGQWFELLDLGTRIYVHGKGLIPDMAKLLKEEAKAA